MRADLTISPPHGRNLTNDSNAVIEVRTTVRDPEVDLPQDVEHSNWSSALDRRHQFVSAAVSSIKSGDGSYPCAEAIDMGATLEWVDGKQRLLDHSEVPGWLRIGVTAETASLLPELLPLPEDGGRWIDQLGPIYRVFNPPISVVPRTRPPKSLVVVYQSHPKISEFVEDLRRELDEKGVSVQTFCGLLLEGAPPAELDKIFRGHYAVLFVGRTEHQQTGACTGWWLDETGKQILHKKALEDYFSVRCKDSSVFQTKGAHSAQRPMAELIFINGCGSAATPDFGKGEALSSPQLSYPQLFLAAGARFVVGTVAEIDLRPEFTQGFLCDFFVRYLGKPSMAVEHLHQTKIAGPAPVFQASLYQIYADNEIFYRSPGEPAAEPIKAAEAPLSPLAANLAEGKTVEIDDAACVLGPELASDASTRMFFAEIGHRPVFVQFLTEIWREQRGIEENLDRAISELQALKLGASQMIPERRATARIQGQVFHALIYLRSAEVAWTSLSALQLQRSDESDLHTLFQRVLRWGALASTRLAELHAGHGAHGNIAPGSFLICRTADGHESLVLKDAWLRGASPVRRAPAAYAAPECTGQSGGPPAEDCWSLGCILYELAAGLAPFDDENPPTRGLRRTLARALGLTSGARTVPVALNRVIRECLLPEPALRPSAMKLAQRLTTASELGGAYLSEFAETIHHHAEAGVRVLAVHNVHDHSDLLDALQVLAAHDQLTLPGRRNSIRYQLYRMEINLGLVACGPDGSLGRTVLGWLGADEVAGILQVPKAALTDDLVAQYNAGHLLPQVSVLQAPAGARALVVIRGSRWWDYGPGSIRQLSFCQSEPHSSPLLIIADEEVLLPESAAGRAIEAIAMPSPSPAALFECILNFVADDRLASIPALEPPMAATLVRGFRDQPLRQVRVALRMCALAYGVIDERALELAENERETRMSLWAGISYLPAQRLPDPNELGFETSTAEAIDRWASKFADADAGHAIEPKRRVVVTGPPGSGRTSAALHLAARLSRPVVTLDPGLCLGSALGESERKLNIALGATQGLGRIVVVIDNADRIFSAPRGAPVESSLAKIAGRLRHWLEHLPEPLVIIVTAKSIQAMPLEWRRVLGNDFRIRLDSADADTRQRMRESALKALFRRHDLAELAGDANFVSEFALKTLHGLVPCPDAAVDDTGPLGAATWTLQSSADIAHWISSVLLLDGGPREKYLQPDFWREAARPRPVSRP